jgi:uncharacterized cupin superfamily protein
MAKRIDPAKLPEIIGTLYPPPFDRPCRARGRKQLGDAAGVTQFGINLLRLAPGAWSSQRHWHQEQDEFVYVVAGEIVLVTDTGEEILKPGDCAGFRAGDRNGHHLQNRGARDDAIVLEIGSRTKSDKGEYSDIDMAFDTDSGARYLHKDRTPYADFKRRGPDDP